MAIEVVSFLIENGGSFHSYVSHYQRVNPIKSHEEPPFSYGFPMVFLMVYQRLPIISGKIPTTLGKTDGTNVAPWKRILIFSPIDLRHRLEIVKNLYGHGSKPWYPSEHQNRWYMDVHPPKYGTIGFDPWPYLYVKPHLGFIYDVIT